MTPRPLTDSERAKITGLHLPEDLDDIYNATTNDQQDKDLARAEAICEAWPLALAALQYERERAERYRAALRDGHRKLATYTSVYPGDKELRRLLAEWTAALAEPEEPK